MLLPKQTLSEAARKQYTLFTNPFDGEVTSDAEMFINGEIRFVHETAWQAAVGGRMVAVIGESGAGKTTMLDDLKEKIVRGPPLYSSPHSGCPSASLCYFMESLSVRSKAA